jgi:hypothetical protein
MTPKDTYKHINPRLENVSVLKQYEGFRPRGFLAAFKALISVACMYIISPRRATDCHFP